MACKSSLETEENRSQNHRRSEEHTSELQSQSNLVCRLLLEKKKKKIKNQRPHTHKQLKQEIATLVGRIVCSSLTLIVCLLRSQFALHVRCSTDTYALYLHIT